MPAHSKYEDCHEEVCRLISEGYSLRQIGALDGMPDKATVLRWLADRSDFQAEYAAAQAMRAEHLADEILEIADDGTNDYTEHKSREDSAGIPATILNAEAVARSRLRIDARKWLMAKFAPKKYGDKLDLSGSVSLTHESALAKLDADGEEDPA